MRVGIRQSYVYGLPGAAKTPASQRWMPLDRSLAEKLREHQLIASNDENCNNMGKREALLGYDLKD